MGSGGRLRQSVSKVWYAGDDDQAVHRWMGVDVGLFMNACDDVEVLDQSYRVPNAAHALAQRVVSRIVDRHEKRWRPTDREGSVTYHRHWYDVDIDYGSWTIMARTNRIIQDVADSLRDSGYYFERNGRPSIDPMLLKGIDTWETLADSIAVSILAVRDLYKLVPKRGSNAVVKWGSSKSLEGIEEDTMLTYDDLVRNHGMLASKDTDPMSIVNMSLEERRYMNLILKRGEDITKPRIRLSTIHAMKGGEDDNVMLFTESAYPCVETKFPDDEHRIFYTGITRTKENLHIIESGAKYRYEL
jgi:superfamily I DNA/RNA helicase